MIGKRTYWPSKHAASCRMHSQALKQLADVALTDSDILLVGSEITAKRPYAEFIHQHSRRSKAPLVAVNCAAIKCDPLESVLFGVVGANPAHFGSPVQAAEGGTIFLDQIHELSQPSQLKLLRFLEGKEYRCLGEGHLRHANVRFIAASSADLTAAVRAHRFHEQLLSHLRKILLEDPSFWKKTTQYLHCLCPKGVRKCTIWLEPRAVRTFLNGLKPASNLRTY